MFNIDGPLLFNCFTGCQIVVCVDTLLEGFIDCLKGLSWKVTPQMSTETYTWNVSLIILFGSVKQYQSLKKHVLAFWYIIFLESHV